MANSRLEEIVRQFPENGLKLLLENPANVRDLLNIVGTDLVELIDLDRLRLIQTTFVERDFRHVESDVVFVAPMKKKRGGRRRKELLIYVLIEHQSQPDRLMPLRMLEYVVQIFKFQTREWSKGHDSLARIRLMPVLPIVFYTGTRRWDSIGSLVDLIEMGERFRGVSPILEPLFLNLRTTEPAILESKGGFFGRILELVQQRKARSSEFGELLTRVVRHLESMGAPERLRWLELLSYIHALVYHGRKLDEIPKLTRSIEASVEADEHRQEILKMGKSYADVLMERGQAEGELRGKRSTLLRQLRNRFKNVPDEVVAAVEAADDVEQLDAWLDRILTAGSVDEMGILPRR